MLQIYETVYTKKYKQELFFKCGGRHRLWQKFPAKTASSTALPRMKVVID
jgi:hypothetical protein